ncbi:myosin-9-like, partial [Asbolus verrucosus]
IAAPNEESASNSSSLTLSLTPPLSDAPKDETSTISEHLSSIENDRSMQEIEVMNLPENFTLLLQNLPEERISQEPKPPSLNSSFNSNSIISLNGLERFISTNMEGRNNARSILEEILNNDQFKSESESKEESLDIFANLVEYHNALAHKDEQIEKLTTSLQQSILNREEMKQHFKNEIGQLQEQLETTSKLLKEHKCGQKSFDFDDACAKLERVLDPSQSGLFNDLKVALNQHVEEKKRGFEQEITTTVKDSSKEVLELKLELDAKHSKEMEELRTYFEKKCADLEKNYSEEVFSQQSRKMSGSSSCSEMELSSDFVFSQPGPGGDAKVDYTKKDIAKMHQTLTQVINMFDNYNVNELSDDDFDRLKHEIGKFDLRSLIKCDLASMRSELQNKYHAELEILREDFDNRVDVMNVEHENKLRSVEKRYLEEIDDLNAQLRGRIATTVQQEVANSGEFEIDEVVQSYERRLQEQVTLAKIDIIAALESQIQRLVVCDSIDEDWPEELLQLKARFAEKYQQEIAQLKDEHQDEIARLKEEHMKNLNGALERARRRSLRDADSLSKGEIELLKERDALKKQTLSLRNLLGELLKYFTQCEDELNNTLVEELISKNLTRIEEDLISPRDSLSELTSLTRKLITETQIKNELVEQLSEAKSIVQSLESDRSTLENQLEAVLERQKVVENDLLKAKEKIAELIENGHREIVSEGYGEDGHKSVRGLAEAIAVLKELQEKARNLVENPASLDANIMHLIEDLSRMGEKIAEEARKDHDDLKQQIEAADKKYKITCQFLEEQAAEREQERDEAQREIDALKEHLKEREKDRASCERITNEVENLEQQLRDMSKLVEATERRCKEAESERKEAVDKIFELRDIIRDLEEQVRAKADTEEELKNIVAELELIVKHQASDESDRHLETIRDVSDIEQLHRYIGSLEGEVQKLRLTSEIAGSEGAIQQIKNHLCDFETTLDKRTKDLEGLHSAISTSCSSPSEDMSIRDVVHQDRSVYDECEVPLQQLARLKEKLLRHSRAEDAAVKRIRDLEMQILSLKTELEESQSEREILKKQISDHLVLISNLQIRLDEQRIRAEHIEKQTNTSLEVQNYDLKNMIGSLEEKIAKRDRTIAQLKLNIEETKRRLEDREKEISSNKEDEMIAQMQEQMELLRSENLKLKTKIDKEAQMLPNLVENIISDKNSDIEMLREKLSETEKQLELFTSLSLNKSEIEALNKLRLSGISFQDLIDLEDVEQIRKEKDRSESLVVSPNPTLRENRKNETVFLTEPEVSTIERVGPPNLFFSLQVPHQKANSTEKHVRFEDEVEESKINQLQKEIAEKDEAIRDYEDRLQRLKDLEKIVEQLQSSLEETENNLRKATESFEQEQKKNEEQIEEIREELAARCSDLVKKEEELEACRQELEDERERLQAKDKDLKIAQRIKIELKNSLKIQTEDLSKELMHVQQLVAEKEKIIDQMGADSRSLHVNLETIQSKLQETGNVVDLGRRLREEQKKNSALYEELHALKAQLLGVDKKSIDDITGQVQRELDYSAYLDSTLINAVGDSSLENEDVEALKLALKKQKSINKQLAKTKEHIEKKFEDLERKHEDLTKELDTVQYEDAILIGQLRTKLDSAVGSQMAFDRIMEAGKSERSELEGKLKSMKQKMSSLPDFHNEKRGLTKRIEILEEENGDLRRELKARNDSIRMDLEMKDDEIHKLETKLAGMTYNELAMKDKVAKLKAEVEQKSMELSASRSLAEEMDGERKKLIRQLEQVGQKSKATDTLPDKLMQKIRELNDVVKDNMKMVDLITRLNHEKSVLEERILDLEGQRVNLPFDDPASRANYLFAKYLRSESYRKALAWQKRYLISLLETYQTGDIYIELQPQRRKPRRKFKHVALLVLSVCRMKYLVRRWHSGKRIVQQRAANPHRAQFQVGQPVSSQNFAAKSALNPPKSELPWFGTSPPSKEAPAKKLQPQDSLSSPAMLSKYLERFNQIQDKLGLDSYH